MNAPPDHEHEPQPDRFQGIIAFWVTFVVIGDVAWAYIYAHRYGDDGTAAIGGAYAATALGPVQLLFIGICLGAARARWAQVIFAAHAVLTLVLLFVALTDPH